MLAQFRYRRAERSTRKGRFAAAHRDFARAASAGHVEAQYCVASNYSAGRGCVRSGSEAIRWYEKAAEAGHTDAQFEIGVMLLADRDAGWCAGQSARWAAAAIEKGSLLLERAFPRGTVSQKDNERAVFWLTKAAEGGKPEAQANLGWLLLKGIGCAPNRAEALRWLSAAAARDIGQAAFGLAELYGAIDQREYDPAASLKWLRRAADLGSASAAFNLGRILLQEPEPDPTEAERYFTIAAEKNVPEAAFELATLRLARMPPDANPEPVLNDLRAAAKVGHAGAAFLLGEVFSRGDRIRPDLREAAQWFQRAANAGHVQAQFQIGCFYARGEGLPKDLAHAARYFALSATGGHAIGALNAGIFYETGQGVLQDLDEAMRWLRVAADLGLTQAQARLGALLASRNAHSEDAEAGRALLEQAAAQANPEAEIALAQILLNEKNADSATRAAELLTRAAEQHNLTAADLLLTRFEPHDLPSRALQSAIAALEAGASEAVTAATTRLAAELLSGRHLPLDSIRAERLLQAAAERGDAAAQFNLGVFYCQRNATREDITLGLKHYVSAAEAGHLLAQYNAGVMYLNGVGTAANPEKAERLLRAAAVQGLPNAIQLLDHLKHSNSSSQLREAAPIEPLSAGST